MIKSGFDFISPYYDFLARLVFGRSIQQAQTLFLKDIPDQASILVIGGGTGWILPELFSRTNPRHLVYLEASPSMINLARQKINNPELETKIQFRLGTEKDIRPEEKFDVVISFFFLDLFLPTELESITAILVGSLQLGGLWLVADFVKSKGSGLGHLYTKILTRGMYAFFRVVSGISATKLPNWENLMKSHNLVPVKSAYFYHTMIKSVIYLKK